MYCPLCKAEYRDGFYQCSDCLAGLVTQEEAESAKVMLIWHGTNVAKFDEIVAALRDAGVPNLARSGARADEYKPGFRIQLKQMSWEISVLDSDSSKSEALLRDVMR